MRSADEGIDPGQQGSAVAPAMMKIMDTAPAQLGIVSSKLSPDSRV
ncbi:MAG: hypothetical protein GVY22_12765 [Gammaproteobacteria bacterium]|nr:hypothetical protein [Gammaproteobacteria bacterium]